MSDDHEPVLSPVYDVPCVRDFLAAVLPLLVNDTERSIERVRDVLRYDDTDLLTPRERAIALLGDLIRRIGIILRTDAHDVQAMQEDWNDEREADARFASAPEPDAFDHEACILFLACFNPDRVENVFGLDMIVVRACVLNQFDRSLLHSILDAFDGMDFKRRAASLVSPQVIELFRALHRP